ncbi:MAG: DNA polymerase III subunit gamma/tau, partial [Moraxellaceae bacterium]
VNHLKYVLEQEVIPYEESALWQLGRAADGSMRDAMSLTDQAIAYGSGKITEAEVATMLGTLDQAAVYEIVSALASLDGKAILGAVQKMSEQAPDFANALAEMLSMLHRIAIAQALPEAVDNSHGDKERIMQLAQQIPSEDVQLFYQTALLGRRDLPLAPDSRAGFEMVLLRMLAFKPQGVIDLPTQALPLQQARPQLAGNQPQINSSSPINSLGSLVPAQSSSANATQQLTQPIASQPMISQPVITAPANEQSQNIQPVISKPSRAAVDIVEASPQIQTQPAQFESPPFDGPYDNASENIGDDYDEYASAPAYFETPPASVSPEASGTVGVTEAKKSEAAAAQQVTVEVPEPVIERDLRKVPYEHASPQDWPEIYLGLGVTGILQSTVANCQLIARQGNEFQFILDETNSTLYDPSHQARLADLLGNYFI